MSILASLFSSSLLFIRIKKMMKLFKKKKSDRQLSATVFQQERQQPLDSSFTIAPSTSSTLKKPLPMISKSEPMMRTYTPPVIVMPKPRRALTPTRAILSSFDHDKTQVEDEEEETTSKEGLQEFRNEFISPILLPISHHEEPIHQTIVVNKNANLKQVPSYSTVRSDESRVYESALESLSGDSHEDNLDDAESNMFDNIKASSEVFSTSDIFNNFSLSSPVVSNSSTAKRVPVKSIRSSATITPPQKNASLTPSTSNTLLIQKEEQEILLQQLKKQVELMEQQRILDLREWSKKEQELLDNRQQMMETLIETKDQLTNVLKIREENKAKEANYQRQLQQQQLHQLQQQQLQKRQLQFEEQEQEEQAEDFAIEDKRTYSNVLPTHQHSKQKPTYYCQKRQMLPEEYADEVKLDGIRSEGYARVYNSRSSSRASNYPTNYQQAPQDDERRSAISRRNSTASNKSGAASSRIEPSPSTTLVPSTPKTMYSRRRAKSIESNRWHEGDIVPALYDNSSQQYYSNTPRRSRSTGRRSSEIYYGYYDEFEDSDYKYYNNGSRYASKNSYNNNDYYIQQPYTHGDIYNSLDYYNSCHSKVPFQMQQVRYNLHPNSQRFTMPLLGSYPYN